MKTKKAQIKMIETVVVIIIFMIVLMIVIVFFSRFQRSESQFVQTEKSLRESIQLAQIFSSLPEIACTESNAVRENCIDLEKLRFMDEFSQSQLVYYYDVFGYGTVTIEKIYPKNDDDSGEKWTIYDRPKDGSYFTMAIPMTLYEPRKDETGRSERYFGLMEVVFYDD